MQFRVLLLSVLCVVSSLSAAPQLLETVVAPVAVATKNIACIYVMGDVSGQIQKRVRVSADALRWLKVFSKKEDFAQRIKNGENAAATELTLLFAAGESQAIAFMTPETDDSVVVQLIVDAQGAKKVVVYAVSPACPEWVAALVDAAVIAAQKGWSLEKLSAVFGGFLFLAKAIGTKFRPGQSPVSESYQIPEPVKDGSTLNLCSGFPPLQDQLDSANPQVPKTLIFQYLSSEDLSLSCKELTISPEETLEDLKVKLLKQFSKDSAEFDIRIVLAGESVEDIASLRETIDGNAQVVFTKKMSQDHHVPVPVAALSDAAAASAGDPQEAHMQTLKVELSSWGVLDSKGNVNWANQAFDSVRATVYKEIIEATRDMKVSHGTEQGISVLNITDANLAKYILGFEGMEWVNGREDSESIYCLIPRLPSFGDNKNIVSNVSCIEPVGFHGGVASRDFSMTFIQDSESTLKLIAQSFMDKNKIWYEGSLIDVNWNEYVVPAVTNAASRFDDSPIGFYAICAYPGDGDQNKWIEKNDGCGKYKDNVGKVLFREGVDRERVDVMYLPLEEESGKDSFVENFINHDERVRAFEYAVARAWLNNKRFVSACNSGVNRSTTMFQYAVKKLLPSMSWYAINAWVYSERVGTQKICGVFDYYYTQSSKHQDGFISKGLLRYVVINDLKKQGLLPRNFECNRAFLSDAGKLNVAKEFLRSKLSAAESVASSKDLSQVTQRRRKQHSAHAAAGGPSGRDHDACCFATLSGHGAAEVRSFVPPKKVSDADLRTLIQSGYFESLPRVNAANEMLDMALPFHKVVDGLYIGNSTVTKALLKNPSLTVDKINTLDKQFEVDGDENGWGQFVGYGANPQAIEKPFSLIVDVSNDPYEGEDVLSGRRHEIPGKKYEYQDRSLNETTQLIRCSCHEGQQGSDGQEINALQHDLLPHYENIAKSIEDVIRAGGNVLIHCQSGSSRSAGLVLLLLNRWYNDVPLTKLAWFAQSKRGMIKDLRTSLNQNRTSNMINLVVRYLMSNNRAS
jgi:hypothetical protein